MEQIAGYGMRELYQLKFISDNIKKENDLFMANSKLQDVGGINLKVRLRNPQFIVRLIASIVLPALAFVGFSIEDLTSWNLVGEALLELIKSPIAIGIIILNIINIIPDPTKTGLTDSELVINRENPKQSSDVTLASKYTAPQGFQYPEDTPNATMEEQMDELEKRQQEEEKLKK